MTTSVKRTGHKLTLVTTTESNQIYTLEQLRRYANTPFPRDMTTSCSYGDTLTLWHTRADALMFLFTLFREFQRELFGSDKLYKVMTEGNGVWTHIEIPDTDERFEMEAIFDQLQILLEENTDDQRT